MDDAQAEQLYYWQSRPPSERLAAISELSNAEDRQSHNTTAPPLFDKSAVRILSFEEADAEDEVR